jgi:hypothetical protein
MGSGNSSEINPKKYKKVKKNRRIIRKRNKRIKLFLISPISDFSISLNLARFKLLRYLFDKSADVNDILDILTDSVNKEIDRINDLLPEDLVSVFQIFINKDSTIRDEDLQELELKIEQILLSKNIDVDINYYIWVLLLSIKIPYYKDLLSGESLNTYLKQLIGLFEYIPDIDYIEYIEDSETNTASFFIILESKAQEFIDLNCRVPMGNLKERLNTLLNYLDLGDLADPIYLLDIFNRILRSIPDEIKAVNELIKNTNSIDANVSPSIFNYLNWLLLLQGNLSIDKYKSDEVFFINLLSFDFLVTY